jgi:hypothetical protein
MSDGEDLGPRIDWLADLPIRNPWGRQPRSAPAPSQEVPKQAPPSIPASVPSPPGLEGKSTAGNRTLEVADTTALETADGLGERDRESLGDGGSEGMAVGAEDSGREEAVEGAVRDGTEGLGPTARVRRRGGRRRMGSAERAQRAGLSAGEIEELELEEAILAVHAAATASASEDELDADNENTVGSANVGEPTGRHHVYYPREGENFYWPEQGQWPPPCATGLGTSQGASGVPTFPGFFGPGYAGFGQASGSFTYPGPPPFFNGATQAVGSSGYPGYPGVYTPIFPAPGEATFDPRVPSSAPGYSGAGPSAPDPSPGDLGAQPFSGAQSDVPGEPTASGTGTAGVPRVEEEYIRVPVSLLRRYYELEWDAWVRRYKEWQDMYSSYQYYYHYYAGGGSVPNPQQSSVNNPGA